MKKEGFSSRIGFILAAAGSAVGLGNIWRFPYLAAQYGGGIFLLTYLVLMLTFGYALLLSENCIGRMTGRSPIGAFRKLCRRKGLPGRLIMPGGWINALVPMIILPYYCVIGGWVSKYVFTMFSTPVEQFTSGKFSADYFTGFITSADSSLFFFLFFVIITALVVCCGVEKGIERFNKILMPVLILLIIAICIYCAFLPNAKAGFIYYLKPEWSKFSYMTVVEAMGQLFFSLSIAMGIMITYGSYMRKSDDLVSSVNHVELFDTVVSFLAGLMIIPAVVAFGGEKAAANAGPGLIFVIMPQVFASFSGGQLVGLLFFILVLFAAATSAVSLLETNVHTLMQEMRLTRVKAISICLFEVMIIGTVTVLGYNLLSDVHPLAFIDALKGKDILDTLDFISNSILMPIGAIFTTLLVIFIIGVKKICNEIRTPGKTWYREYVYRFCILVIVIPCLLIVLLNATGLLKYS
ncbi:MAG: sodium-dependent transporter [Lentisphaeria bacterium]|nr:sodium-dependent transporter [Lentisphaeria bacterium]